MLTTKAQGRGIVAAKPSILEEADVRFGSMLSKKSKIERRQKSRNW
jgi:hypothetical protein